ncbi:ATP-grasp domain protein [Cooperia oncophora]
MLGRAVLAGPILIASSRGGVNIEEVAASDPDAIIKVPIDMCLGVTREKAAEVAALMGFQGDCSKQAAEIIFKLYKLFRGTDATLLEINPMAEDVNGNVSEEGWTYESTVVMEIIEGDEDVDDESCGRAGRGWSPDAEKKPRSSAADFKYHVLPHP